jgi:hypothetical protein
MKVLLVIYFICVNFSLSIKNAEMLNNIYKTINKPDEIVTINSSNANNDNIRLDLSQSDPLEYMKLKNEITKLYKTKSRFKQTDDQTTTEPNNNGNTISDLTSVTKPTAIGQIGDPKSRELHSDEEILKITSASSNSIYTDMEATKPSTFTPDSILKDDSSFWCSTGHHELNTEITFEVEFMRSNRIYAIWIYWAFAPGEYMIRYRNESSQAWVDLTPGFKPSRKEGTINWWKSILSNPKTRWQYKSFDERIDLDEPIWARYFQVVMKVPVNFYFGIYKLEFYTKIKSVVMIKSLKVAETLCLSVINGSITNYSPVVAIDCLQAIAYGDNRDLFVLHSNGYITTYRENKCIQSQNANTVDILECGNSSEYKDDRDKWILEYDGKIRSAKEEFTCLSITDLSVSDDIKDIKASASSVQNDGMHGPERAIEDNALTYWASDQSSSDVTFEVYFNKHPYMVKSLTINWKIPAKSFKVMGLFQDGFWKVFYSERDNRQVATEVDMQHRDLTGIKILMTESTTIIEEKHVYGIILLNIRFGGRYLNREPCSSILMDSNKFDFIDISITDGVSGTEYKKAIAELHQTRTKIHLVQSTYVKVPETILHMKETSFVIKEKLKHFEEQFSDIKLKLSKFEEFLNENKVELFTVGASEYFPVLNCSHIKKAFPSKRSGMYWIKTDCMNKAQQVYCDFTGPTQQDYLIFNNNQTPNVPMRSKIASYQDIRYQCNLLGLEPFEIKNEYSLRTIFSLLKLLSYDLNSQGLIPIAYDYSCETSNCSSDFRSLNENYSQNVKEILNQFIKENESSINSLFRNSEAYELFNNDMKNIAAFGKNGNIVYEKLNSATLNAIICSNNNLLNKGYQNGKQDYINIECDTNLRSDVFAEYPVFANLRLVCPSNCDSLSTAPVYGSGLYSDNSSVCRAAIHAGVITNEGGIVEVQYQPGQKGYVGGNRNNIDSLSLDKWDKSFKVSNYCPFCPIDKMKDYSGQGILSSFLELNSKEEALFQLLMRKKQIGQNTASNNQDYNNISTQVIEPNNTVNNKNLITEAAFNDDMNTSKISNQNKDVSSNIANLNKISDINNSNLNSSTLNQNLQAKEIQKQLDQKMYELKLIQEIEKLKHDYSFIKHFDSVSVAENKYSDILTQLNSLTKFLQEDLTVKDNNGSKIGPGTLDLRNQADPLSAENIQANNNPTNNNELLQVLAQKTQQMNNQPEDNNIKNFLGVDVQAKSNMTTDQALQYMNENYLREKGQLDNVKKISDNFKSVIGKAVYELNQLSTDRDSGIASQNNRFDELKKKLLKIQKIIYEIDKKLQNKLKMTAFNLKKAKENFDEFLKGEAFIEDFANPNINENWEIVNSKKGKGNPAKWEYFSYNVDGHFKTIRQTESFKDNRSGSHLVLKSKDYYDFELKFSLMIKDGETFGVSFRYRDYYNYYTFEITNQSKRIRKFKSGQAYLIDQKNDGGCLQQVWYNVKITAQQSKYYIYMAEYNSNQVNINYEKIFEFNDNDYLNGTIAFNSNGVNYLLLDSISITPLTCTNFDNFTQDRQIPLTPTCSRFTETFKHGFLQRWKVIDPIDVIDGPSIWKTLHDIENRDIVLVQQSNIAGISDDQEGSAFVMKDVTKSCNKGKITIQMKALDEGIIGIVFRFENNNFYVVELSQKFIRMRKKVDNKFSLIASAPIPGYERNIWFGLMLTIYEDKFNVFLSKGINTGDSSIVQVFDKEVSDNDLKFGVFGLTTYKTKLIVSEVIISPFEESMITNNNNIKDDLLFVDEEVLDRNYYLI